MTDDTESDDPRRDVATSRPASELDDEDADADALVPDAASDAADAADEFEEMAVDTMDPDAALDEIEPEDPDEIPEGTVRVVSDRTCHGCRFFADPPDLACTHAGTEIRRVVDTDHFEVVNCPIVVDYIDVQDSDDATDDVVSGGSDGAARAGTAASAADDDPAVDDATATSDGGDPGDAADRE